MNLEIKENLFKCKRPLRPDQSAHSRLSWCSSTDHNALGEERCRLLGLCDFSKRNLTWDIEELSALISQHIVDYPDVAQQTIMPKGEERCRLLNLCDFSKTNITWEMEDLLMSV